VYAYGWGIKGNRIYGMKNAEREKRLSFISTIHGNEHIAPLVFEGTCDRRVFETYIEKVLLPVLKSGQTLIMDNASIHKGGRIKEMIEQAECEILYLPPYSPDLNPIEHHWAPIKSKMRHYLPLMERDVYKAAEKTFQVIRP
jgi:transposase